MTRFSIAAIGTCRIHNPLRRAVGRYPIRSELGRNYGFVHTTSEALQQLRYMLGQVDVPAEVRPLIFRPGTPNGFDKRTHEASDLYLVELSSRKLLTVDGHPIQMNYMARYFADFFGDKRRAKLFWSMATEGQISDRRSALQNDSAYLRLTPQDRELLARIIRRDLDDTEIEQEMQDIVGLVGKDKVVFVTHVNAATPDNMPIEQRVDLINSVRSIAKAMNQPCYDPTPLMKELGQSVAMENGGLDLTHYSELFCERLCEDWYRSFVLPRLGTPTLQESSAQETAIAYEDQTDTIEALWADGNLLEASRKVRAVLRTNPNRREHKLLLARMQYELGDYEGATVEVQSAGHDIETSEPARQILMQCYFLTEQYQRAKECAYALIADEKETPEILRICAVSAQNSGDPETALTSWKRLFHLKQDVAQAADAALQILNNSGDSAAAVQWANEVRESLPTHAQSFVTLWQSHISGGDRKSLLALAREGVELDEAMLMELARRAADSGFATPAALLACENGLNRSANSEVNAWIAQVTAIFLSDGVSNLDEGNLLRAADKIQARWILNPNGNDLIRTRRQLERQLRQEVRAAVVAKDFQKAADILGIAAQTAFEFPEIDSYRIRVAEALGDTETALAYLKKPFEMGAADAGDVWIRLARLAVRGGYFGEAIDAYGKVIDSGSSNEAGISEATRQILGLRSRAIRLARELAAGGEVERAWAILERLERIDSTNKDVPQEKRRIIAALHAKVKSLNQGSDSDRLATGELLLRLVPVDAIGLKAAAVSAMRLHRFEVALQYWKALRQISTAQDQIDVNIQKCHMLIDRISRKKAA